MPEHAHTYTLTFRAPVSIFTGLGIAGLVDRAVVREANQEDYANNRNDCLGLVDRAVVHEANGLPYIPGSSVKGRLRFFAERLLRSGAPQGGSRIHALDHPACKVVDTACTVCRLFGNPSIPALLRVGQASPAQPWDTLFRQLLKADANPVLHPDVEIRPGIALSRLRRTALPDHLFFDEAVPAITFQGSLLLDTRVTRQEIDFLLAVGTLVDSLGARKVTGRGALASGIRIQKTQP